MLPTLLTAILASAAAVTAAPRVQAPTRNDAVNRCKQVIYANVDNGKCINSYTTCYAESDIHYLPTELDDCARQKMGLGGFPKGTDLKTMIHRVCLWDHTYLAEEDCLGRYAECNGGSLPEGKDDSDDGFFKNWPIVDELKRKCKGRMGAGADEEVE